MTGWQSSNLLFCIRAFCSKNYLEQNLALVTTQVLGTSLGTHSSLPQGASNHAWLFELVSTALASSLGSEAAPALAWRTLGSCPTTATKGNRLHWWHFFKVSKETKKKPSFLVPTEIHHCGSTTTRHLSFLQKSGLLTTCSLSSAGLQQTLFRVYTDSCCNLLWLLRSALTLIL